MRTIPEILAEIEAALPTLEWTCATPNEPLKHYTGRGKWTIQLVSLDTGRMGTASQGALIMKLTDELAEKAEREARVALRCSVMGPGWAL